ncbi:AraC family transcriptional regulator [Marinilabiliaceae bacterium JC040]|nr:AraC family transcriptional regulator [Marinilabiliaceae bacterium JC040]
MNKVSIENIFEIHIEEMDFWEKRPYTNNFFEIAYIDKGSGFQCINQHEFKYHEGDVFFLPPLDCHSFKILNPTRFYFIRFTDHYFLQNKETTNYSSWFDKITYILANYNKMPGDIISSNKDRQFIINNIKFIYQEYISNDHYSNSIISGTIVSILNILARSVENKYVSNANKIHNRFGNLLRYINTHLVSKEKLQIDNLSNLFGISQNYFSEYFKKHAGISLAEYILKSKLKIVESKILHTDLSLKEIAWQLNFTDNSHLAKSFKKYYGITTKEFKNKGQVSCDKN